MKQVLWFSRNEMTPEQKAALGSDVEINQINKTINSAYDLKDEIENSDIIAVAAPIDMQAQFLKIANGKPVLTAVSERILIPQENGESKTSFVFQKWEQLDKINIEKSDYEKNDKDSLSVTWISRHAMSPEQQAAIGSSIKINQIDQTLKSAKEIESQLQTSDVVGIVGPIGLQQQIKKIIGDKPLITAKMNREMGKDGTPIMTFDKWEKVNSIEVQKHDFIPEINLEAEAKNFSEACKKNGLEQNAATDTLLSSTQKIDNQKNQNINIATNDLTK